MNKTVHITGATPASGAEEFADLGEMFRSLWRQKRLIAAVTLLCVALGATYAYQIATPKYRATSVLLLDTSGRQLVDLGVSLPSLGSSTQEINTEVEVLKSRRLLQRVVFAENLTQDPEFNDALQSPGLTARVKGWLFGSAPVDNSPAAAERRAINALLAAMRAHNLPKTDVLQITVETESGAKSAALADQIARQYILYQMDVKFDATKEASNWLSQRVADLKIQLEDAEARVAAFTARTDVVSRETVLALDRQLKDMRNRAETLQGERDEASGRTNLLRSLITAPAQEKSKQAGDARLTRLFQTEGASDGFDQRFDLILSRATLQSQRIQAQAEALGKGITELEQRIATQSNDLIELQHLTREAEANRLLYEYFLSRLKENSAQEGIQQADSRILSNAVVPNLPSEPKKSLILVMSAVLGLLLGAGGAVIRNAARNSFRTASELELETGLSVMGQIPLLPTKSRREAVTYLKNRPSSAAAEAIRNLRTSVLLSDLDAPPQVILSTSSLPDEGKTTISFALAQNLVGMGKKVLLVEGDMRRLVFRDYLDRGAPVGLLSVLSGASTLEEAIIKDPALQADILMGEPGEVNAADVLSSQKFRDFLELARGTYDHIIIDTPPVLVVPDARVIAPSVDLILFTVRWDQTPKEQIKDALRMLSSVGQPVGGLVLNQIDGKKMKRYGQGRYGTYGNSYYTN
ncbi:polysaccharide biosynthesis tyrosine autokinase [Aliiroseovarius crassostreae]|uniref:GumC family protein n=1 Tax=Aliiroseovarius crassostreae TaxID=154981 RepID=UPI0021B028AD|nr:polysaccharide biosynthesis tyrosine autokinase [Aliiroseovarius crassostreae]UWQ04619.1 polysaccharide biosynthesis tyrosine autokinase [Aliiroseovarius crassostreae]